MVPTYMTKAVLVLALSTWVVVALGASSGPSQQIIDDQTLRADEPALLSLEQKLQRLKHDEENMRKRRELVTHKLDMIRRVQHARAKLRFLRVELSDASDELKSRRHERDMAEERRRNTDDEKEAIAEQRRKTEASLSFIHKHSMSAKDRTLALEKLQHDAETQQKLMEKERDDAMKTLKSIGKEFESKGFENWIKINSESLPFIVKGSIFKASEAFAPIAQKFEIVAEANDLLSKEVASRLHKMLPSIKRSPFYDGILFYILLLCPTVLAVWLVLKVHGRLSQLSVAHYVVAINLYFGTMSLLCLFMSLLSHNDILIVFRHRSRSAFEAFTLLHALLFVLHLGLHGVIAHVSKYSKDYGQLVSIFCVGLHFFVHAYKRAILNQDPNIGAPAYFLYAIIFLYTLYDRGITILEAAVNDDKSTNGASFATYAPPGNGLIGERDRSSKKMVYFAGLPVFSSPNPGPVNDVKSI